MRLLSSTPRRRCQLNSNVRQHKMSRAVLHQSQRLRRESSRHDAAGAAKHWPASARLKSSGALAQPKFRNDQHLGSCERRALRQQSKTMDDQHRLCCEQNALRQPPEEAAAARARAIIPSTTCAQRHRVPRRASAAFSWHARGHHRAANHVMALPNNSTRTSPQVNGVIAFGWFLLDQRLLDI